MRDLEKHADWLDYKKKISSILNGEPLETRHNQIVEVQVTEEEWRKMQMEIKMKGMIIEIRDGEDSYEYPKMNWMKYKDGNFIISYQDENDEERIETGSAPDEIIFHPYHVEEEGEA